MCFHRRLLVYLNITSRSSIRISHHQEAHSHSNNNLVIQFHSYLLAAAAVVRVSMELHLLPRPLTWHPSLGPFHYFLPSNRISSSHKVAHPLLFHHQAKLHLLPVPTCHTHLLLLLDRGAPSSQLHPLT